MHKTHHAILAVLIVALMAMLAPAAQAQSGMLYDVTITNLTRGQVLSPPVVVSHTSDFHVFNAGEPASPELAALAEDADSAGLIALLGTDPQVNDVNIAADVVPPGSSITVQVYLGDGFPDLTVLGMLVTTNDAFFSGTRHVVAADTFDAIAYDAGSEANTQRCAHIPGPPCDNPGVRVTHNAEGFISVSSGIRRAGDLSVRDHDWRNPAARISVRPAN